MKRKLRMGMIGGGKGAFIGAVHRMAANLDGLIELCSGAFSSDAEKSRESGERLFIRPERVYDNYRQMIEREASLPAETRIDFVSIVTPNHAHFEPAMLALEHDFHVVIDKPFTFTSEEALLLEQKSRERNLVVCITYTYAAYPMVKQARKMVADGAIGEVRKVYVEYPQGWLSRLEEKNESNKQAVWRTDPALSGKSGVMGDIGTHAANMAEYVSGLKITRLCADLNTLVEGRQLDDDGAVLLRFEKGASGVLIATQVAAGEENPLSIRVYGEKGGLEWHQMEPNTLIVKYIDKPIEILRTGGPGLSEAAILNTRIPAGHPEGYLEAFANIYRNFCLYLSSRLENTEPPSKWQDFPQATDGLRGMQFIDRVVESASSNQKWTDF